MPRISTDNYDTVAAWNGSQDLFVVEQPDGTKVATPAMVKQFMEAGDFEATGEITDGHGNILKDMAKSADVSEVIGDLSQTGVTGASVAAQLEELGDKTVKTSINPTLGSNIAMDHGVITVCDGVCYFAPNFYSSVAVTIGTVVTVGQLPNNCIPKVSLKIPCINETADILGVLMISYQGVITYYPKIANRFFGYVNACFEVN